MEHSTTLSTCIQLPPVFKTFVLSIFEWPLKTGFTVYTLLYLKVCHWVCRLQEFLNKLILGLKKKHFDKAGIKGTIILYL